MTVRASAKNAVDTRYGMPSPMWRTSAAMVPKTATMAATSQKTHGTYWLTSNWSAIATVRPMAPRMTAITGSIW
jgi:hypothetical protein